MDRLVALLPRPPSKAERQQQRAGNPFKLVASLSIMQHLLFTSGMLAWVMDAYDFFSVSLSVNALTSLFNVSTTSLTLAITLTLLFRSLGAALFGLASDRFGRKWPLIINLICVAALELGSSFVNTYGAFLAVRSLFGVGMGGIWGLAASNGLENMPLQARGLYSGILQQGYAVGYLFVAVVNLCLPAGDDHWRTLFRIGAGVSLFAALFRLALPESQYFLDQRAKAAELGEQHNKTKTFLIEAFHAVRTNWIRCIYAVLIMSGFNFLSHASQDIYPTYLENGKLLSASLATKATIIGNCGAIAGGTIAGFASQIIGRRLTIIVCCCWTLAFIPLWTLPSSFGALAGGAFATQMGVQGAWGVVPVYLQELSPPAFRAVWPGLAYQLGNAASSASSQIESIGGDHLRTTVNGKDVPDYARVLQIFLSAVAAYLIFLSLFGVEAHSADFEHHDAAFIAGAGNVKTQAEENLQRDDAEAGVMHRSDSDEKAHVEETVEKA